MVSLRAGRNHPLEPDRSWAWWGLAAPVLVAVLALAAVVALAVDVRQHSGWAGSDPTVTAWFVSRRTPTLTAMAQVVTTMGSEISISLLSILLFGWLVFVRTNLTAAVYLSACTVAGAGLIVGTKHVVGRPRPPAYLVSGPPDSTFSFPSGHTLSSTIFFGVVAGMLVLATHRRLLRIVAVSGWVVLSGVIGLSRLYLGYHWLTDVLAGWLLGVAVLAVAGAVAVVHLGTAVAGPPYGEAGRDGGLPS